MKRNQLAWLALGAIALGLLVSPQLQSQPKAPEIRRAEAVMLHGWAAGNIPLVGYSTSTGGLTFPLTFTNFSMPESAYLSMAEAMARSADAGYAFASQASDDYGNITVIMTKNFRR
jgi:hypothetical protein